MKKLILLSSFIIFSSLFIINYALSQPNSRIEFKDNYNKQISNTTNKKLSTSNWQPTVVIAYDTSNNYYSRQTYTYDANGNLLTKYCDYWFGKTWRNYERYIWTYDTNRNIQTFIYEELEYNAWVIKDCTTYTYYENGNILTECNWVYAPGDGDWIIDSRYTYTYDAKGNMLAIFVELCRSNNIYENYWRSTYTYDANGNMLIELYEEWKNNAWENWNRNTYTYDVNGYRLTDLYEGWQNNAWVNYYLNTYVYDANGNMMVDYSQSRNDSAWKNDWLKRYTYDANGNRLTELHEAWFGDTWHDLFLKTYTYDFNGNAITGKIKILDNGNWLAYFSYINLYSNKTILDDIYCYRYEANWDTLATTINQSEISNEQFIIYPNPAKDIVYINHSSPVLMNIYNLTGQQMMEAKLTTENSINISGLNPGIYILQAIEGEKIYNTKIIKQ